MTPDAVQPVFSGPAYTLDSDDARAQQASGISRFHTKLEFSHLMQATFLSNATLACVSMVLWRDDPGFHKILVCFSLILLAISARFSVLTAKLATRSPNSALFLEDSSCSCDVNKFSGIAGMTLSVMAVIFFSLIVNKPTTQTQDHLAPITVFTFCFSVISSAFSGFYYRDRYKEQAGLQPEAEGASSLPLSLA